MSFLRVVPRPLLYSTPNYFLFVVAISSFGDAWLKNDFVPAVLVKVVLVQAVVPVLDVAAVVRCEAVGQVPDDVPALGPAI